MVTVTPSGLTVGSAALRFEQGRTDAVVALDEREDRVRVADVYEGIDVEYYFACGVVELDVVVRPGADPKAVRLAWSGSARISTAPRGALRIDTGGSVATMSAPRAFQTGGRSVAASYHVSNDRIGFDVGDYDASRVLIIDPLIAVEPARTFRGTGADRAMAAVTDAIGNLYVAGSTTSQDLPVTYSAVLSPGGSDAFVAKFASSGDLLYSVRLGGSGDDEIADIAIDATGAVYVCGTTRSRDFSNAAGTANPGGPTGFAAKIAANGQSISYARYLSPDDSLPVAIAASAGGTAVLAGNAGSLFAPTANALQRQRFTAKTAFVARISASGEITSATLLGNAAPTVAYDLAIDPADAVYVTGATEIIHASTPQFPTTATAMRRASVAGMDAFVVRLSPDLSGLEYGTLLGGSEAEGEIPGSGGGRRGAVAVRNDGLVVVAGVTASSDLYVTPGALQRRYGGGPSDGFLVAFYPFPRIYAYSTFLGGSGADRSSEVVQTSDGVYVAGVTTSSDFPDVPELESPKSSTTGGVTLVRIGTVMYAGALARGGSPSVGGLVVRNGVATLIETTTSVLDSADVQLTTNTPPPPQPRPTVAAARQVDFDSYECEVRGSNFQKYTRVLINGIPVIEVTYVSSTLLLVMPVPASAITQSSVTVINPDGQSASAVYFPLQGGDIPGRGKDKKKRGVR